MGCSSSVITLICSGLSLGVIPTDWIIGIIVAIWKGNGDIRMCSNHRGLVLRSTGQNVLLCTFKQDTSAEEVLCIGFQSYAGYTRK